MAFLPGSSAFAQIGSRKTDFRTDDALWTGVRAPASDVAIATPWAPSTCISMHPSRLEGGSAADRRHWPPGDVRHGPLRRDPGRASVGSVVDQESGPRRRPRAVKSEARSALTGDGAASEGRLRTSAHRVGRCHTGQAVARPSRGRRTMVGAPSADRLGAGSKTAGPVPPPAPYSRGELLNKAEARTSPANLYLWRGSGWPGRGCKERRALRLAVTTGRRRCRAPGRPSWRGPG